MERIGVFVCWCGTNIAATIDVEKVAEEASKLPFVVFATDYKYMCSDPGQKLVMDAIEEHNLTGVVISACSPKMHEVTFRRNIAKGGLNPYMLEMANIREHSSWVHHDMEKATEKAIDLVRMAVGKAVDLDPLEKISVSLTKRALVIGGGVSGIQTALDIADGGVEVVLLEKSPSIGGYMSQLDETFPTLDCSQCILTPKMVDCANHPNITIYSYSELSDFSGYIGNFKATIKKKPRYVDMEKCTGCGICYEKCPQKDIPSEFEAEMGTRTAIYTPFPQAVPNIPVIDVPNCLYFQKGICKVCQKVCPTGAIDFEQTEEYITLDVGAVVVATGFDLYDYSEIGEYGYGNIPDVIDGLQFERLCCASGPTEGEIVRPSDGKKPETVVFVQCVGSRDDQYGGEYCSKICCMYTAKHTILLSHKSHGSRAYVFYIDIRAGGKGYEEFIRRATEEEGATYIRGRVSKIYPERDKVMVKGMDTLSCETVEIPADLVVLATAIRPREDAVALAQMLGINYDQYGFYIEAHPKLKPIETSTAGIYLAGTCQAPQDIPDAVSHGSGAASKVLALFSSDELEREPLIAYVDTFRCSGCLACKEVCPYDAIEEDIIYVHREGEKIEKTVAKVNEGKCAGCGNCLIACRSSVIDLYGARDIQVYNQVNAYLTPVVHDGV